ncbi:Protein BCP1 [Paramyrothecium foliicola]|nr:Protein BCP1 [Paramyrothecium foliicola]
MGKKRTREVDGKEVPPADGNVEMADADSGDDEDFDMVNVDFEWFNFDPEVDFHGIKSLMRQLLDVDATLFNMSALADLILSQPTIGSTIKVDGKSTDPYAMVTALNIHEHREKDPIKDIVQYLGEKAQTNDALSVVPGLLASGKQVALVLSERLINMPSEIAPPLYSMLVDEIEAAVEDKEPYEFSHYLILSKVYQEVESTLDVGDRKSKKAKGEPGQFYFHVEDEMLQRHALAHGSFEYTKQEDAVADSKRAFQEMGVKSKGYMILIEANKLQGAIQAVQEYLSPSQ